VVPLGGHYVTRDISAGLRVPIEEAERIKIAFGKAREKDVAEEITFTYTPMGEEAEVTESVKLLAQIIEPRVVEMFELIRRELNRSNYTGMLPAGAVLSGGGAMLTGLRELGVELLGMPVRIGYPSGVGGLTESVSTPSFSTGVGLVQWGGRGRVSEARREPMTGLMGALWNWMRRVRETMRV